LASFEVVLAELRESLSLVDRFAPRRSTVQSDKLASTLE